MPSIIFKHVDFSYPGAPDDVFRDLSLLLDTAWRTGMVGRNGQGKTTLLRLVSGALRPLAGSLEVPVATRSFPAPVSSPGSRTLAVVREAIAPFAAWERDMARCLEVADAASLERHAELHEAYLAAGGYGIDARIAREFDALALPQTLLQRPFGELSGGEQTRALIVALFLAPGVYPLIDEPTNHLDEQGRALLTGYLARQRGFLLVSHDRRFLDGAVDHVLSLNRNDVRINQGTYSQWRTHMDEELQAEQRTRQRIERDVARLKVAALDRRRFAADRESDKYRTGALDKGYIGHRAARQMKRARSVEHRIEAELAEKQGLLANQEKQRHLAVTTRKRSGAELVTVQNLTIALGGRTLFRELSFAVEPGARVAVTGPNGCGKTSLLDAVCGADLAVSGSIRVPGHVRLARGFQHPPWNRGSLRRYLGDAGLEETRFRQLLGVLGVGPAAFERDLGELSQGELKKIDLCRCLLSGADVLLLDEPLNYVDLYSREQIEASVLENRPTLLFVEHDQAFVERVATREIRLGADTVRRGS